MKFLNIFAKTREKSQEDYLSNLSYFFSALGDPTTLKILKILSKRQKLCVSDVARAVQASISSVSHQMGKLKKLGIVRTEREGKMICYYLLETPMVKVIEKEFLKNAD